MRKKFKFKIENRDFIILEPTVEQYWLSLYDFSEFLNEIFWWKIPKIDQKQIKNLCAVIFSVDEEKIEDKIFKEKEKGNDLENFHILIARLMKYFWNSYKEIMEIPFGVFKKFLEDFKKIEWDLENKTDEIDPRKQMQELFNLQ